MILAEYKREQDEMMYRIYMTEAARLLTENTARFARGQMMTGRYYDIINKKTHQETKSGDEIV